MVFMPKDYWELCFCVEWCRPSSIAIVLRSKGIGLGKLNDSNGNHAWKIITTIVDRGQGQIHLCGRKRPINRFRLIEQHPFRLHF